MIEPSRVIWTSNLPSFINIVTQSANVSISGSVANLQTRFFFNNFDPPAGSNFVDIYITNGITGHKMLMDYCAVPSNIVYSAAGTEGATTYLIYPQIIGQGFFSTSLSAGLAINNSSGAPITLTNQTLTVEAVFYRVPF